MKKNIILALIPILLASSAAISADVMKPVMFQRETKRADMFSHLPPEKASLFQKQDAEMKAKYRDLNIRLQAATTAMNNSLLAEPFNKDEYLKKAAEVRKIKDEKIIRRNEAIVDLADKFTATERKMLISAFEDKSGKKILGQK